jgi:hypothetical protein
VVFSVEAAVGTVDNGSDDDMAYSLGSTLYPTSHIGIGASYTTVDSAVDREAYEVFVDWFFTPTATLTISYSDSEKDLIESDSISLLSRFRF